MKMKLKVTVAMFTLAILAALAFSGCENGGGSGVSPRRFSGGGVHGGN